MENKMAEVAKLLGLKLGEEFTIKGVNSSYRFKLTAIGLMSSWRNSSKCNSSGLLEDFITGHYQIAKEVNSVLDEAEMRYLTHIIKPFRYKVKYIIKNEVDDKYEYISIIYHYDTGDWYLNLPNFKAGAMYKGMTVNRGYTLEQLEL